ncbi:MAG: antibiotic biosynthesis monooxygenase [Sphingomonas sp.]|jgi:heme-degrading monooxygenase HmoA|uniref:antibiotic biosynthesis monooxygenase family protein n=1 Tax=Sphingomonas sp. TaxID=28214 RepID=UPI00356A92E0
MFSVLFEILPHADQRQAHAALGESLLPDLEAVAGFVDSILYKSLARDGWLLSLSTWRDEKSVVRWRTNKQHHEAQVIGRAEMLEDYRLRVCEVTYDTEVPEGCELRSQRLDESEVGSGVAITLIDAAQVPDWVASQNAEEIALYLGFDLYSYGDCITWDVFEAIHAPGDIILLCAWKDQDSAVEFAKYAMGPEDSRIRVTRIVRDYSMFDRREAPQYFPDAPGRDSVHG